MYNLYECLYTEEIKKYFNFKPVCFLTNMLRK